MRFLLMQAIHKFSGNVDILDPIVFEPAGTRFGFSTAIFHPTLCGKAKNSRRSSRMRLILSVSVAFSMTIYEIKERADGA